MNESHWGRFKKRNGRGPVAAAVLSLAAGVLLAVVAVFAVAAQAGVDNQFARVERAAPTPAGAKLLAAPAASAAQSGYVVLKPRDESALQHFIAGVTNTHSASYHHYLKAGQFRAKFGPTSATVDAVKAQLVKDGLTVGSVSRNGLMIRFSGTTTRVQSAFDTKLQRMRTAAGTTGQLATKAVKLPASIAPDVSAVLGLNTLVHPQAQDIIKPPASAYVGRTKAKTGTITRKANVIAPNPGAHTSAGPACKAADGGNAVEEDASQYGGLTDDQIANAYGATSLYNAGDDGAGVHIGLYELEPFLMSDLQSFDQCYFGDAQAKTMIDKQVKVIPVDGGNPTGPGSGEAILDIEDISAMAPGADIDVYSGANSVAGAIDVYSQMISDDQDQIITSSWGFCEQDEQLYEPGAQEAENYIFQQAAAQGQTVLNATGDTGDDGCNEVRTVPPPTDQNPLSIGDAASQPYVLAVGGTTIQDANPKNYDETAWNDGANWGGGNGGISQSWAMPSWQQDSLVPGISDVKPGGVDWDNANYLEANAQNLGISDQAWPTGFCQNTVVGASSGTPCRATPDVSADADEFTGAVTIYSASFQNTSNPSSGWVTIGGTSSASPIWAAMLALVDQSSACTAIAPSKGGTGVGFVPPLLYALASNPSEYAQSFHDITVGNNDTFGFDSGKLFPARKGFDMATGLGSPMLTSPTGGTGLAADLCGLAMSTTAVPSVTTLNPTTGSVNGGNTLTVTGTGFESGGSSDVSSVQVGGATIPGSDVTVTSNTSLSFAMPAATAAAAPPGTQQTDGNTGVTYYTGGSTGTQDGAGPADIVVTTTAGASSPIGVTNLYEYVDQSSPSHAIPTVTGLQPYAALESDPGTVNIYGSGFAAGDAVKIGGVAATNVTVVSPYHLTVTPPDYSSAHSDCVTSAALTTETGDSNPAADDICQTEVVVTGANGPSSQTPLEPTYEGPAVAETMDGLNEVPVGYELTPQPTEFDYVPTPSITSVSTSASSPSSLASEGGTTTVTVKGTGLNEQTLNWLALGDPTSDPGQVFAYSFYSGTELQFKAPAVAPSVNAQTVPIYADTLGDGSNVSSSQSGNVVYAGIPVVKSVAVDATSKNPKGTVVDGLPVAPDQGGDAANTALTVTGSGFSDADGPLLFTDIDSPFSESTSYGETANSNTQITGTTPNSNPAVDDTQVCTVSGCSAASSQSKSTADEVLFYPPGKPVISKLSVSKGPAAGGQSVTITGENLGCTTGVMFGTKAALSITPTPALLDCGATGSVTAVAPPGTKGSSVTVKLTTVESQATGGSAAVSPTKFTYTANPTATPTSVQFGNAILGKTGATRTVSVKNPSGAAALSIGKVTVGGSAKADFKVVSNGCLKATLNAGKSCAVKVRFAAMKLGSRTATLMVPFDQAPKPLSVSLHGTGKN